MLIPQKIYLTAEDVWRKKFRKAQWGYRRNEVDEYLDLIIKDYQVFEKQIEDLMQENLLLRKKIAEITNKQEINNKYKLHILHRLSRLEKHVFSRNFIIKSWP